MTEADVNTTGYAGTAQQAEAAEATVFSELASTCRAQPACVRSSVWGVSVAVSWLGASAAGLPLDTNYLPSRAALLAELANPVAH